MMAVHGDIPYRYTIGPGASLKRAVTEAARLLDQLVESEMETLGLSSGDADVLTAIRVADYDPVPSEIAQWLGLTGAGATGRLNSLERRGLLERLPHPTDGRSVTLHLTEAGLQLADAVIDAKDTTVVNAVSEQLGEGRAQQLVAELDALTAVAREAMDRR